MVKGTVKAFRPLSQKRYRGSGKRKMSQNDRAGYFLNRGFKKGNKGIFLS